MVPHAIGSAIMGDEGWQEEGAETNRLLKLRKSTLFESTSLCSKQFKSHLASRQ